MKAKHTKQIYFIKLKHTIKVYISDNEYRFSVWLLYTERVYVYWYSILYYDTMLSLYLTKVCYAILVYIRSILYYNSTHWHIKHILNEYTLNVYNTGI